MRTLFISIILLLTTSVSMAQSVGGGGGSDRPGQFLSRSRPLVIDSTTMSCNEVQDFIIKNDKARVNLAYKKVNGFNVIFSRYAISCGDVRMVLPVSIPTKDRESCYAGYTCQSTFR